MPITRAKATALLNQGEMQLYDDSRSNAIRGLDARQLDSRITRARAARNRARDLVQRQKLASRDRTGNKRGTSGLANQRSKDKVEILADVLKRFEAQLKLAGKAGRDAPASGAGAQGKRRPKAANRKAERAAARRAVDRKVSAKVAKKATKKTVGKTAKKATGKAASGTAARGGKKAAKKTAGRSAAGKTGAAKKGAAGGAAKAAKAPSGKKAAKAKKSIGPRKALKNTRTLLEARQEEARQPKPWQTQAKGGGQVADDGFQTGAAARKAERLHAAQSRIPAIQGSISTRDRINQGKRDSRGSGPDEG